MRYKFSEEEEKAKSKYKLWVLYKPPFCFKLPKNPQVYFGYYRRSDFGYKGLCDLAENRKKDYYVAILYDNQAADRDNNEVRRWESEKIPENIKTLMRQHGVK